MSNVFKSDFSINNTTHKELISLNISEEKNDLMKLNYLWSPKISILNNPSSDIKQNKKDIKTCDLYLYMLFSIYLAMIIFVNYLFLVIINPMA